MENKKDTTVGIVMVIAGLYLSFKLGTKIGYHDALKDVVKMLEVAPISQK